jgi:phosphoglycerate dehydrogenase-like enzyme
MSGSTLSTPQIAVILEPEFASLADAVVAGGGVIVDPPEAEGLIWAGWRDRDSLQRALEHPGIRWVQLPMAGIERYQHLVDDTRVWTSGKGVHGDMVAELALCLGLAGLRNVHRFAQARQWQEPSGTSLVDGRVTIVGGGAICESLVRMLAPFGVTVTVVRRSPQPMEGVARVLPTDQLHDALGDADLVVLALALTEDTVGIIGKAELELMAPHAWIINVARGSHIVTDDLVSALRTKRIGGAGLDVTDPEPLPTGHPLWDLENCIVTPHAGGVRERLPALLSIRIQENVERFARGEPLLGQVDARLGY